jgi:hypothetical protein
MESKYDRVDVPHNLYLHSEGYSEGETEDFGTGVYPISVISRKSNFQNDTVKVACFKMRRKSRCLLMIGGLVFLLVLVLIIVIVTKHNDATRSGVTTTRSGVTTTLKADNKTTGKYKAKKKYVCFRLHGLQN